MEVAQMIIALALVIAIVGGSWAWWHQQQAVRVLRARPSHVERTDENIAASTLRQPTTLPPKPKLLTAPQAVQQLERVVPEIPSSVLGWETFSLDSTLVLDGSALLACSRQPDEKAQGTLVLLIGDDDRAAKAVALLESWRDVGARLRLRPTTVAGAIEVYDDRSRALRAALLAA
jgi:hypothetical protein